MALTTAGPAGVSATQGSPAWTSKKIAPVRRTAFKTSDKASTRLSPDDRSQGADGRSYPDPDVQTTLSPIDTDTARRWPMNNVHNGSCFCGAVKFEVSGTPEGMGFCHCESCRSWSAGPVNAFTLWKPASLKVT